MGKYKDTITIHTLVDLRDPIGDNTILIEADTNKLYADYAFSKLDIIIDTLQNVILKEYEWWEENGGYKYYKAHPIIIHNKTDSITKVGYGFNIPVILEAMDIDKIWKPLEGQFAYDCGVDLEYILLKQNEILCVLVPIYSGDFKTKLRYRFGNNLTKEFFGTISRQQFISIFDSNKY